MEISLAMFERLPFMALVITGVIIVLITLLVRWLLFRFIPPLLVRIDPLWADILQKRHFLNFLTLAVPGILVAIITSVIPNMTPGLAAIVIRLAAIYSIVMLSLALISMLYAYNDFYEQHYEFAKQVPIKTLIQTLVVFIIVMGLLLIIATFFGVSLLAMASIIAGVAAVLAFMFREPLLGFSASLQLSMNNMLAIGDWIEMGSYDVDGEVQDINITSTKVRNWDNSIVNVPTYALIQNSFRNWQAMHAAGARRILRAIYIDQNSIGFASPALRAAKEQTIAELYEAIPPSGRMNEGMQGVTPDDLAARERLTNLELYMAYATQIITGHPQTRADYSIYVRQLDPSPQGLPVQTYFFTSATDFVPFHAVQREIFSHLLAILPEFDLQPYQVLDTR